jgi:hypothetical protein
MDILSVLISLLAFTIAAVFSAYAWNRLRAVSYILIAWFVVAFGISQVPFFQSYTSWESGDLLGLTVFSTIMMIPLISLIWAWQKRADFRAFLDKIPTWVLISTQLYRVAGFLLLAGYLQDKLPFEVGFVNGLLDITVAILAIFLAWFAFKNPNKGKGVIIAWNVLGFSDLMIALSTISLSLFGVLSLSPEPAAMGMSPFSLIGLYQVPLALFIHLYLIARMRKSA